MEQGEEVRFPGRLVPREFYDARPEWVAPRLLGKLLICKMPQGDGLKGHGFSRAIQPPKKEGASAPEGSLLIGRIVEVEAYLGPHNDPPDPAAHSHRGPTPRNLVLFGHPGYAYVYSIYGKYFCLNISCEIEGQAGCVLLRALDPLAGIDHMALNRGLPADLPPTDTVLRQLTSGPSRLCQALAITRPTHNGLDVASAASPLQVRDDGFRVDEAMTTPRIGINPTNPALDWPLRFVIPGNRCLSGPKSLRGRTLPIP